MKALVKREPLSRASLWATALSTASMVMVATQCAPAAQSHPIPRGKTYLMAFDGSGSAFGFVIVRKGSTVTYAWSPSAGHPNCFRGIYDSGQLRGERITDYPTGPVRSTEPLRLRAGKSVWRVGPNRYFLPRSGTKRYRAFAKKMNRVLARCAEVTWAAPQAPATPVYPAPPNDSAPPAPPTTPPPTNPPPPPPPPSATITGNTCTTAEKAPNCGAARVSAAPNNSAVRLGEFAYGQTLTARCWTSGQLLTDGNNADPSDDSRTFTSDLWYGMDWNGGRGYVSAVWTTKSNSHLSLPQC